MKTSRIDIFLGIKDSQSLSELLTIDDVVDIIENNFVKNKVDFSICKLNGGWTSSEKQIYVSENTVMISIVANKLQNIEKIIAPLKMYLNQECILINQKEIEVEFL